jgi:hypothetical protein
MLGKKRKLQRDGVGMGDAMDMRIAMGMAAFDFGLDQEDEDEALLPLSEDQMVSFFV